MLMLTQGAAPILRLHSKNCTHGREERSRRYLFGSSKTELGNQLRDAETWNRAWRKYGYLIYIYI
jgi:hypothetical protein